MRMRTKQKIHFLILNIRESIHSLARNRIIFMNLFFFSFSMGSLLLLFILFVAIEFTSTLAYNYGDPISVRIKYQYNEVFVLLLSFLMITLLQETTDWFDLPYEKVPLFKKHGSLVIQPSLSISISKYTPLKAYSFHLFFISFSLEYCHSLIIMCRVSGSLSKMELVITYKH